ncbi:hypothetical protein CkP1_0018 [Citrobacter phage CkP1]|nr:hypothetical protein CkP1_0018 [Citrobacter phage CkP1]
MAMPREIVIAQRLVHTYKSASSRSKEFNLSMKYLMNIMKQDVCAYSGERFKKELGPDQMTLERFDNNKGYVEGNVIPVKLKYNKLRANYEIDELVKKQEELSSRITRAADAKEKVVAPPNNTSSNRISSVIELSHVDLNRVGKKERHKIDLIVNNILNRRSYLKQNNIGPDHVASLEVRIKGGIAEVNRIYNKYIKEHPQVVKSGAASKRNSKAEISAKDYDIIIQGLTRFQNLSRLDKAKLNKGLPLSATLFQLIRGKM